MANATMGAMKDAANKAKFLTMSEEEKEEMER